ncbi:MAG: hypothetical protein LBP72_10335 [Dysgonamonadaceae bacterium]|jgi:hypothetical protein|nr:hypothetical protein [Dysgonamonadaceae bacterium]
MRRIGQIITDFISVIAGLPPFLNPVIAGLTRNPLKNVPQCASAISCAVVIPRLTRDPLNNVLLIIRGLRVKPAMTGIEGN